MSQPARLRPPQPARRRTGAPAPRGSSEAAGRRAWPLAVLLAGCLAVAACGEGEDDAEPELNYGDRVIDAYDRGKASGARGDLQTLSMGVTQYLTATGELPEASSIDELAAKLESGRHVRRAPRQDPWGNAYQYETNGRGYWLRSSGQDGVFGNDDDLVVEDGQIVQLPLGYERPR